jgi:hypothetical protein
MRAAYAAECSRALDVTLSYKPDADAVASLNALYPTQRCAALHELLTSTNVTRADIGVGVPVAAAAAAAVSTSTTTSASLSRVWARRRAELKAEDTVCAASWKPDLFTHIAERHVLAQARAMLSPHLAMAFAGRAGGAVGAFSVLL